MFDCLTAADTSSRYTFLTAELHPILLDDDFSLFQLSGKKNLTCTLHAVID